MDDKKAEFLPFHAINEFMIPEYRLHIIQTVLAGFDRLPSERRSALNGIIKKSVQVPGFRNSSQAPSGVKARASVSTFERRPEFVANILQGWSDLKPELRQQVYDFLKGRGWEVLPPEADRTKLPGFMIDWPKEDTYDALGEAFKTAFPDAETGQEDYDFRLMIVWVADKLPYNAEEE